METPPAYKLELYYFDGGHGTRLDCTNELTLTFEIDEIDRSQNGTYGCSATTEFYDSSEGIATGSTDIIVYYPPSIFHKNESEVLDVSLGDPATIRCIADAYPIADITWYKNNNTILGDDDNIYINTTKLLDSQTITLSELFIISTTVEDFGMYTCIASNGIQNDANRTVELRDNEQYAPEIYILGSDILEIRLGDTTSIGCMVDAYPVADITWYDGDNNTITGNDDNRYIVAMEASESETKISNHLVLEDIMEDDLGKYTCVATNGINDGESHQTVEVKEIPPCTCSCNCYVGLTIFLTVIITLAIVAAVQAFLYFFWWKRRQTNTDKEEDSGYLNHTVDNKEENEHEYMSLQPSKQGKNIYARLGQQDGEIPGEFLCLRDTIGEGAFGKVVKGEAWNIAGRDGMTVVAVKMLKDNALEVDKRDLLKELDLMKSVGSHPHVVSLLGCCTHESDPTYVILEYMCKGNLQNYLRENRVTHDATYTNLHQRSRTLTERDLMKFALDVAMGMEFLSTKQCVHRDLAARNILINEHNVCKMGDFGLARDVVDKHQYERKTQGRLPIRWMSIESVLDDIFTTKSDVWSFGVLLWEIVSMGYRPYPGMSGQEVIQALREGYRMPKPSHCKEELYAIMISCWNEDPEKRPQFTDLVMELDHLVSDEKTYINIEDVIGVDVNNYDGERC
ncbi:fibroblast growth factor receptor-like [Glandiceps talaboti]